MNRRRVSRTWKVTEERSTVTGWEIALIPALELDKNEYRVVVFFGLLGLQKYTYIFSYSHTISLSHKHTHTHRHCLSWPLSSCLGLRLVYWLEAERHPKRGEQRIRKEMRAVFILFTGQSRENDSWISFYSSTLGLCPHIRCCFWLSHKIDPKHRQQHFTMSNNSLISSS